MCNRKPLYGELTDMLNKAESEAENPGHLLVQKFNDLYRHIATGQPERFYDTVIELLLQRHLHCEELLSLLDHHWYHTSEENGFLR